MSSPFRTHEPTVRIFAEPLNPVLVNGYGIFMLRQARLDAPGTLHFECFRKGSGIEGKYFVFYQFLVKDFSIDIYV